MSVLINQDFELTTLTFFYHQNHFISHLFSSDIISWKLFYQ